MRLPWRGFTLIELIVVVLILGILAAVAMVGYAAMTERAQVTAARAQLTQVAKAVLAKATVEGTQHLDRQLVLDAMEESLGAEVVDGETASAWRLLDADTTPETVNDIAVAFLTAAGDVEATGGHTAVLVTAAGKGLVGHKVAASGLSCGLDDLGEANTAGAVAAAAVGCSAADGAKAPENPDGPGALPAPTGVTAVSSHRMAIVSWDPVAQASGYTVEVHDGDGVVSGECSTTAETSCMVTGLTNGQQYHVDVTASFDDEPARTSGTVTVTPQTPKTTMRYGITDGIALVEWDAVPGVAEYEVWWELTGGPSNWFRITTDTRATWEVDHEDERWGPTLFAWFHGESEFVNITPG